LNKQLEIPTSDLKRCLQSLALVKGRNVMTLAIKLLWPSCFLNFIILTIAASICGLRSSSTFLSSFQFLQFQFHCFNNSSYFYLVQFATGRVIDKECIILTTHRLLLCRNISSLNKAKDCKRFFKSEAEISVAYSFSCSLVYQHY
jgi:hypothetical protein